jgi:FKBP-type peptidyl-prolyl cis-trans isomerase FkpA
MIGMRMIFTRYILVLLPAIFFFACNNDDNTLLKEKELRLLRQYLDSHNIDQEPESSGIYFISLNEGSGKQPSRDDWVIINYTARLIDGRIFDTTDEEVAKRNNVHFASVIYGERRMNLAFMGIKGVLEGLMLMKEESKARLIIPSHLAYGSTGTGSVPAYSTIIYDIELVKVISDPEAYEIQLINDYLGLYNDSTHLSVQYLNGIYFIELDHGEGENHPDEGDMVRLFYRGKFTDGRIFDSNIGGNALNVTIGRKGVIPGFEAGIKLMKEEDRARIIIPSSLAYGPSGQGTNIPGYTPLVFDLELVELVAKEE